MHPLASTSSVVVLQMFATLPSEGLGTDLRAARILGKLLLIELCFPGPFVCLFVSLFLKHSLVSSLGWAGLEFVTLLPLPPKYQDYVHVLSCPAIHIV